MRNEGMRHEAFRAWPAMQQRAQGEGGANGGEERTFSTTGSESV